MRYFTICLAALIPSLTAFAQQPENANTCARYRMPTLENRLISDDHRSDSVDLLHTEIYLDFRQIGSSVISGIATVTLKAKLNGVQRLRFDFEGLTVDSVVGAQVTSFAHQDSVLNIWTNELSQTSEETVTVYYHGTPMQDASGWGGFYNSGNFAFNLGVGFADDPHSYGRIWFPCFDNFVERTTFGIHLRANTDRSGSANGTLQGVEDHGDGSATYHWSLSHPVPSYLACFAVAPYVQVTSSVAGLDNTLIPIVLHARSSDASNLNASFVHLPDAVQAFEDAYGKYRFEKVGYSLVPFNSGAMEHVTNITYPISAANGSLNSEELMAHELAHMWWGDNVTCMTDGDMWINEGWASFSEYLFQEWVYDRRAYEKSLKADLRYMLQFGHHMEDGYRPVSGQPHEYVYGDHVYKKGALAAHNLRGYLGDDAFFSACAQFMEQFAYKPVSSDTLLRYFSAYSGVDLVPFFRDWVLTGGYNAVVLDSFTASANGSEFDLQLFVQQKLKGRSEWHTDVPVYFTAYDDQWNSWSGMGHMSGQYAVVAAVAPFKPVYVTLYDRCELAQARTVDKLVLKQSGNLTLSNAGWSVDVESVQDSALIWFEQFWCSPDQLKDRTLAYRLSGDRFWRISGLDLDKVAMSGYFFYDGRAGGGNTGYLDLSMASYQEDSLVLLYRTGPEADWAPYDHYSVNIMGSADNAFGMMELDQILSGEYVLAVRDESVLAAPVRPEPKHFAALYPNPAADELTVTLSESTDKVEVEMYDVAGRLVRQITVNAPSAVVSLQGLPDGDYLYTIRGAQGVQTGQLILARP